MNSFVTSFAIIVSFVHGDSCNYYTTLGIAEDYCNVFTPTPNNYESSMFTCVDDTSAYLTIWDNDDCSGDANSTRALNYTGYDEFSCSTNDDSCSIISLTVTAYSSNGCTGDVDESFEIVYYLTDNSIDCEPDSNYYDYYYTRTLSVSDGLWIQYYTGDTCNNSWFDNTIENGYCASSKKYTFANDDSGASDSGVLSQKRNIGFTGLFGCLIFFLIASKGLIVI